MKSKRNDLLNKLNGKLFLTAGIVLFALILVLSLAAVRNLSAEYRALESADLSVDFSGAVSYDDHLYGSIGHGIEIDSRDSDNSARLAGFLEYSLRSIDRRIISCILVYTMIIAAVLAYRLFRRFGHDAGRHTLSAALAVPIVFAAFFVPIRIAHAALHLPFYVPAGAEPALIGVSLLAVIGGSCFLAWVLRAVRLRLLIAVIAIPAVLLLFMLGTAIEGRLFCSPTIDTFDYIAEEVEPRVFDEDFDGEVYYDDERGALILNGEAYAPRPTANPDYLTGAARFGGILFEIVDPWSGNGLFMIHEAAESTAPGRAMLLYAVKAAVFIIVPLAGRKKSTGEISAG